MHRRQVDGQPCRIDGRVVDNRCVGDADFYIHRVDLRFVASSGYRQPPLLNRRLGLPTLVSSVHLHIVYNKIAALRIGSSYSCFCCAAQVRR